jgi:hypothetical protein
VKLLAVFFLLLGATFASAWGSWVLYVGVTNYDPQSEIPRWTAFPVAAVLLGVGAALGIAARSHIRRTRH